MERLVVDSSVAIKWFVAEIHSAIALEIYANYQVGAIKFLAPDFINAEVGNILWRKQLSGAMTESDAQVVLMDFRAVAIELTSDVMLLQDAYRLAIAHKRTVMRIYAGVVA